MLDGAWFPSELVFRLEHLVGRAKLPWTRDLAWVVCERFTTAPSEDDLIAWLCEEDARYQELLDYEEEVADEDDGLGDFNANADADADAEPHMEDAAPALDSNGAVYDVMTAAIVQRVTIRQWPLRSPEMRDSPWAVPALPTTGELARWLGVQPPELVALADRRGLSRDAVEQRRRHYRYRCVAKRSGGMRLIEAPKPRLRTVQRALLDDIIARIPPHDACHGFRAGRSVRSFAAVHTGHEVVLRLDLHSFFASIFAPRVAAIVRAAGYPSGVARTIAALCTHASPSDVLRAAPALNATDVARLRTPHLPQGAPTSGALANLAAYAFDVRVTAFARAIGAVYTRYADDLAISGGRELAPRASSIVARVAAIAHDERFAVNFRKTRVMVRSGRQRIAGVVVNDKLGVARDEVDRLRATLHNCIRTGPAAQNRDGHIDFRAHLLGRISWVSSLDPAKGAKLRAMFDRIAWG